jgi:condensin subunit Smc
VVGPNGSGKSNIIDAVRWVLGESAASRLRSENITDVIFAGSSARKPAGQASVELVFDNSEGTLGGEWANFAEISVRRLVSHDGQSNYYINGTRCRRRDITDLFLGTGLGARSYAIIEQGVISDIVESEPEHLRVHLEEAAGISKYKERRKETESRIKATRENLDRIRDVRDEVDKQLDHLNRQARAAERWQALKTEQTRREAELRALEYRALSAELAQQQQALRDRELAIEREQAALAAIENRLEHARTAHAEAGTRFNAAQAETYKIGAEVARVEQQLRHNRELGERLQREQAEVLVQMQQIERQLEDDQARQHEQRRAQNEALPQMDDLRAEEQRHEQALQQAEAQLAMAAGLGCAQR